MMSRLILGVACALSLSVSLAADTLVMRNGTRIEGELIAVRNNIIEFEERRSGRLRAIQSC